MRYRSQFPLIILAAVLVIFSLSCSGSGNPVTPDSATQTGTTGNTDREASGQYLWGLYDVYIDSDTGEVEIAPLRGAMFEANVTKFLHPPISPINMLSIQVLPGSDFASGYLLLNVSIRHPFPGTNLRGFDVMGIFMPPEGGQSLQWDPNLTWPDFSGDNPVLLNADGYTRWWNQPEFTSYDTIFGYTNGKLAPGGFTSASTLNPFKYFADGMDPDTGFSSGYLNITDRGTFDTVIPGINIREYEIQFPVGPSNPDFRFKYAISACYWGPDGNPAPPAPVDDFPLSANRQEAVCITPTNGNSTAFYENESTYGGDLNFSLEIYDWQGMTQFSSAVPEINGIYVESPTLFDGVIDVTEAGIWAFEPMSPAASLCDITIQNVAPTSVSDQYLMIIVTSEEPSDYSVQIPDVTEFDYPTDAVLAAFAVWDVPIASLGPQEDLPPVADASLSEPHEGTPPLVVNLDPSASYDPDGIIVMYEWDIENDGSFEYTTFAPDISTHGFEDPGLYEVQLKVTDDDDLTDFLDEPLLISVIDDGDPCEKGPNLICSGDGNIFVDSYVEEYDNAQILRNIINFDYGLPNSSNQIVKFYVGHGCNHNNSPITGKVKPIVEGEGWTFVESDEEPIDTEGCRVVFVHIPGKSGGTPFTEAEYEALHEFLIEGGRIVLTQEYSDSEYVQAQGNAFLQGVGSTIVRTSNSTGYQLITPPNECEAITDGVEMVYHPAYTSFDLGPTDFSLVDDPNNGWHVLVGGWIK